MAFVFESDNSTFAANSIDYDHHEIHSGSSYFIREANELGNAAVRTIVITTPDTAKWAHFVIQVVSTGELDVVFTEGVTVVGGTVIPTINRNRNSTKTAGLIVKHTPDSATGGTALEEARIGSGRREGGESRGVEEIVLKQNTTYTLVLTNETSVANIVNVILNWYEHTDKI